MKSPIFRVSCSCIALTVVWGAAAFGQTTYTMSNGNSAVTVSPSTQAGAESWNVNGVNQLAQEWFWYAIGSGSASSLDTLGAPVATLFLNTPTVSFLTLSYTGANGLDASVQYTLQGAGTGSTTSGLGETITLTNATSASMPLHFYEYTNFEIGGGTSNKLVFTNPETVDQYATVAGMNTQLSETAAVNSAPFPSEWQGGAYPSLLNLLNSGSSVTLNDTPGTGSVIGPGNMSSAFEWDTTLGANGGQLLISKNKNISSTAVPEPSTLAMLAGGAALLGGMWRNRRRGKRQNPNG